MTDETQPTLIEATDPDGRRYAYLTLRKLGSGSFSEVHLAERRVDEEEEAPDEQRLGRVVLKIASTPLAIQLLREEAKVLLAIREHAEDSPVVSRVVRIKGDGAIRTFGAPVAQALIELEYLDGHTMADWMEKAWFTGEPLRLEDARHAVGLALELARALAEIRNVGDGVLHRDIKPDNVMLTSAGLRLFDFNVSRETAPDDRTLTRSVGSGDYMAPEVRLGSDYDQRADLFSFGVVLYELLTRMRFVPEWKGVPREPYQITLPRISALDGMAPPIVEESLRELVGGLIIDQPRRINEAREVVATLERVADGIDHALSRRGDAALADFDLIQLVGELRPEGLLSVVADSPEVAPAQKALRRRLQVDDPLEGWLFEQIRDAVKAGEQTLVVLAGNAGDGKSHLIDRLLHYRMASAPELRRGVRYIADATHADRPDESQVARLERFFAPFAASGEDVEASAPEEPVSVIAMNTGMVLRFFEQTAERFEQGTSLTGDLTALFDAMQAQLGLRQTGSTSLPYRLLVVNLDLRDPLRGTAERPSFFERMLDRLDPDAEDGLLADHWPLCESCPARQVCSVHFNLEALRQPRARAAVVGLLERAALDPEVHLSPRLLWSFIYRLVTGGLSHFDLESERAGPCDVVRRRVEEHGWLLANHFTEIPFAEEGLPDVPLWRALRRLDPALSSARALDELHTRFAIQTYRDDSDEELAQLGGEDEELCGLSLKRLLADDADAAHRRDAAVRRRVFFHQQSYEAYALWGAAPRFVGLVEAYDAYSRKGARALEAEDRDTLQRLAKMVADVFLLGAGKELGSRKFLRVSQPNPDVDTHLMVEVNQAVMNRLFKTTDLVRDDLHVRAHRDQPELLEKLGYRPKVIMLSVGGHRLVVDLALYEFLEQVEQGRQPSRRDLGQFEALVFLGENLGNSVSKEREEEGGALFVFQEPTASLYRLVEDDFGVPRLTPVTL